MRNIVFWAVAIVATLWNLFGVYDFTMTVTNSQAHLNGVDADFIAWVLAMPGWRYALWGAATAIGLAGGLALLLRRAMAATLFWIAVVLMLLGFGSDFALLDGMRHYGTSGLGFLAGLVALEAAFALYAGWAARQGMLKRP